MSSWPSWQQAVLTLNAVEGNPAVFDPAPVKIGWEAVRTLMLLTQERLSSDAALRALFTDCSRVPQAMEALT